jgi:hypothetical protein
MNITYRIDGLDIIGVIGNELHIRGNEVDENYAQCIIVINKKIHNKLFNNWIKSKKDFCKRYKHYCGVSSGFELEGENIGKTNLFINFDEDTEELIYSDVNVYRVIKYDEFIDMEHG